MPGGPIPEHIKAAAVASVRAGMTIRAAAARHGVPYASVGRWSREASQRGDTPGATKVVVEPNRVVPPVESAPVVSRARVVEAIGPELRRDLRRGVSGIARFIASAGERVSPDGQIIPKSEDDEGPDWQQVAHAARALDILLARVPDVMTFDETTNGKANTSEADAIAARVRATIARRHATVEPAELIAFDGGKSEVG